MLAQQRCRISCLLRRPAKLRRKSGHFRPAFYWMFYLQHRIPCDRLLAAERLVIGTDGPRRHSGIQHHLDPFDVT